MLGELAQLACIHEYEKTYWIMVEGEPTREKLVQLERGIQLKDYLTLPAKVRLLPSTVLPPRCQHCGWRLGASTLAIFSQVGGVT